MDNEETSGDTAVIVRERLAQLEAEMKAKRDPYGLDNDPLKHKEAALFAYMKQVQRADRLQARKAEITTNKGRDLSNLTPDELAKAERDFYRSLRQ